MINGINDIKTLVKHKVFVNIQSRVKDQYKRGLEMVVVPKITSNQPSCPIDIKEWHIPTNISMADPEFYRPQQVDMLLGAELFYDLISGNSMKISNEVPHLYETKIGWVVAGKVQFAKQINVFCNTIGQPKLEEESFSQINQTLERFWSIEGFEANERMVSKEEEKCEEHFLINVTRNKEGRFIVKFPLKEDISVLGDSFWTAKTRFHSLEKKLHRTPGILQQYQTFMKEYEVLNHMQIIDVKDQFKCLYFLPHHCVLKPESTTTKLRVVFDASCRSSSGESLNSILRVGPVIQKDLFSIILRFRTHRVALIADISKMYRQVHLEEEQTYLQCILWRFNLSDPLQIFRLKTITYGTAPASFLVIRCLHYLARENISTYPLGAKAIIEDFYVDDMLSGAETVEQALQLRREVDTILKSGCFELRKWASNDHRVLQGIPAAFCEQKVCIDSSDYIKTLGLSWYPKEDAFRYEYHPKNITSANSKRQVLADIATLFDPLGLINPVIVSAKIFMQHLWRMKLDWDATRPEPYNSQWTKFRKQLPSVKDLALPRLSFAPKFKIAELHGFADASTVACGCCIYVRCVSEDGISCRLLCAKSRVAPIKTISLPRLELCAAELLANLLYRVLLELEVSFKGVFCWSDSEIVLNWLSAHPTNWNTFVANRVSNIQRLTSKCIWNHVDTKNNPADAVSRGATPEKLNQSLMWFNGP